MPASRRWSSMIGWLSGGSRPWDDRLPSTWSTLRLSTESRGCSHSCPAKTAKSHRDTTYCSFRSGLMDDAEQIYRVCGFVSVDAYIQNGHELDAEQVCWAIKGSTPNEAREADPV